MQKQQIKGIPIHRRLSAYAINMHSMKGKGPGPLYSASPLTRHYNLNGLWKKQLYEIKFRVCVSLNPALSCMHSSCYPIARITPTSQAKMGAVNSLHNILSPPTMDTPAGGWCSPFLASCVHSMEKCVPTPRQVRKDKQKQEQELRAWRVGRDKWE